jgi:hypothetical protein
MPATTGLSQPKGNSVDWQEDKHNRRVFGRQVDGRSVIRLLLAPSLSPTVIVSRSMSSLFYGVEPLDWTSLTTSACVLRATAGIAALVPIWRATRVDPMTVLRAE